MSAALRRRPIQVLGDDHIPPPLPTPAFQHAPLEEMQGTPSDISQDPLHAASRGYGFTVPRNPHKESILEFATSSDNKDSQEFLHASNANANANPRVPRITEKLPAWRPSSDRFELLQEWRGFVEAVHDEEVQARIVDLTDLSRPEEIVTLPIGEIPEADLDLLEPGHIFHWCIGYETRHGQKRRISSIRLQRLPVWTHSDEMRRKRDAQELAAIFDDGTT